MTALADVPPSDEVERHDMPAEFKRVLKNRTIEAMDAGLSYDEARRWAESSADVGLLRELVDNHCPPELIREILL